MPSALAYVAVFGVFAGTFAYLQRHPNWSRGGDGHPYGAAGWWKPLAVAWLALLALFVIFAAAEHGFRWAMLLVFPILGGAFALGTLLLKLIGQRQQDR